MSCLFLVRCFPPFSVLVFFATICLPFWCVFKFNRISVAGVSICGINESIIRISYVAAVWNQYTMYETCTLRDFSAYASHTHTCTAFQTCTVTFTRKRNYRNKRAPFYMQSFVYRIPSTVPFTLARIISFNTVNVPFSHSVLVFVPARTFSTWVYHTIDEKRERTRHTSA